MCLEMSMLVWMGSQEMYVLSTDLPSPTDAQPTNVSKQHSHVFDEERQWRGIVNLAVEAHLARADAMIYLVQVGLVPRLNEVTTRSILQMNDYFQVLLWGWENSALSAKALAFRNDMYITNPYQFHLRTEYK